MRISSLVNQNAGLITALAISATILYTSASYKIHDDEVIVDAMPPAIELMDADWAPVCGYLPAGNGIDALSMVGVDWTPKKDGRLEILSSGAEDDEMQDMAQRSKDGWVVDAHEGETVYVPFSVVDQDEVKEFNWDFDGVQETRRLTQNELVDKCQLMASVGGQ